MAAWPIFHERGRPLPRWCRTERSLSTPLERVDAMDPRTSISDDANTAAGDPVEAQMGEWIAALRPETSGEIWLGRQLVAESVRVERHRPGDWHLRSDRSPRAPPRCG